MDELREKIAKTIMRHDTSPANSGLKPITTAHKVAGEILALLPQWTKVEDGMPEKGEPVRVWSDDLENSYEGYLLDDGEFHTNIVETIPSVTYWQPLPTPPKRKEK